MYRELNNIDREMSVNQMTGRVSKAMNLKWLLWYCTLILIAGCATSQITVQSITPDLNIRHADTSLTKRVSIAVEVFKMASNGEQENIIGEAKTGWYNADTQIVSDEPIGNIVTNAIRKGFKEAGFILVNRDEATYIVSGAIEEFHVKEYATGWAPEYSKAYVRYDVIISNSEGNPVWANTIEGSAISDTSITDTTHNNIPTLTAALQKSVESLFSDRSLWKAISK